MKKYETKVFGSTDEMDAWLSSIEKEFEISQITHAKFQTFVTIKYNG